MGMTLKEQIMKLQTYKMFEDEDTVYVERDDVLKTLEQQPCEDCISRAEAINVVHKYFMDYLKLNDDICLDGIRSLPSVTPTISEMEQVEDCISREETLNNINALIAEYIPLMPTGWTLPLNIAKTINELPSVTPSIPDVENDFNLGYNCGYADAMNDIAESEE